MHMELIYSSKRKFVQHTWKSKNDFSTNTSANWISNYVTSYLYKMYYENIK